MEASKERIKVDMKNIKYIITLIITGTSVFGQVQGFLPNGANNATPPPDNGFRFPPMGIQANTLPPLGGEFPQQEAVPQFPNQGGPLHQGEGLKIPSPVIVRPPLPSLKERKAQLDLATSLIKKMVPLLRKRAEEGSSRDQYNLAKLYELGVGVPLSFKKAFDLYKKSAENGNPYAQYTLGRLYLNGGGVSKDMVQAYKWFNVAAGNRFSFTQDGKIITAAQARDNIAKYMTAREIRQAQSEGRVRRG